MRIHGVLLVTKTAVIGNQIKNRLNLFEQCYYWKRLEVLVTSPDKVEYLLLCVVHQIWEQQQRMNLYLLLQFKLEIHSILNSWFSMYK